MGDAESLLAQDLQAGHDDDAVRAHPSTNARSRPHHPLAAATLSAVPATLRLPMQATIRSLLQQIAALGSGWSAGASAFGASAVAAVEMTAASEWPDGAAASPTATSPSATTGQGTATVSWTPPSGPARSDFVDAAAAAAPAPTPAHHSCWRAEDRTEEPGGPFVVLSPRLGLPLRCIAGSCRAP